FIEKIYNPIRLHSSLDYRSPIMFENQQTQTLGPNPPTPVQTKGRIPLTGGIKRGSPYFNNTIFCV
ncbi:hypothetical protein KKG05_06480, partial [bacterium]|nr:hypothetical protein [bacterium]